MNMKFKLDIGYSSIFRQLIKYKLVVLELFLFIYLLMGKIQKFDRNF